MRLSLSMAADLSVGMLGERPRFGFLEGVDGPLGSSHGMGRLEGGVIFWLGVVSKWKCELGSRLAEKKGNCEGVSESDVRDDVGDVVGVGATVIGQFVLMENKGWNQLLEMIEAASEVLVFWSVACC